MSTKRRIIVADLDTPIRSIVDECLPSDHFDTAEFDENTRATSTARVDLVMPFDARELRQKLDELDLGF